MTSYETFKKQKDLKNKTQLKMCIGLASLIKKTMIRVLWSTCVHGNAKLAEDKSKKCGLNILFEHLL